MSREYQAGWDDCDQGLPQKKNASYEYMQGYGDCYENDQKADWHTERGLSYATK